MRTVYITSANRWWAFEESFCILCKLKRMETIKVATC